jgi:hypothetical protein
MTITTTNFHGETDPESQLLGLLGAMKDGILTSFEYHGIEVEVQGNSIIVRDTDRNQLGGRLLRGTATIREMADWVQTKAEFYGDNR